MWRGGVLTLIYKDKQQACKDWVIVLGREHMQVLLMQLAEAAGIIWKDNCCLTWEGIALLAINGRNDAPSRDGKNP